MPMVKVAELHNPNVNHFGLIQPCNGRTDHGQ